jgi:hypothetical protein
MPSMPLGTTFGPRHERVIFESSSLPRVPPANPDVALRAPILSIWQIEENRFGNVPLIIVNGLFTLASLTLPSPVNAPMLCQQYGRCWAECLRQARRSSGLPKPLG